MKPLLWIGSDRHALEACLRLGIDVVLIQGASGRDFGYPIPDEVTRRIVVDDQRSFECLLAAVIREGLLAGGIRAVGTNDERCLVAAGALARALDCPGPDPLVAVRFRDKAVQKTLVAAAGIPVADFRVVPDIRDLPANLDMSRWPVVAKPVAGAGTSMTRLVPDADALRRFSAECRSRSVPSRTFLVERYVPGDEWHLDGVVSAGEVRFLSVGSYGRPCLDAITEKVPVQMIKADPMQDADMYRAAAPVVSEALAALGLTQGIFHMELFHDAATGALTFSECAARRGGGLIQEEVRYKFDVDLAEAAVRLAVEGAWKAHARVRPGYVGSTFLPMRAGTLLRCPSAEEIISRPGVVYSRLELPLGFVMPDGASDTVAKLGQALIWAPTRARLAEEIDALLEWFAARVDVIPPGPTAAELRQLPAFAGFAVEGGSFAG